MPFHVLVLRLLFCVLIALAPIGALGRRWRDAGGARRLETLLVRHLDFLDRSADGALDEGGRVALLRRARKEIGDILATEGYFSPGIEGEAGSDGGYRIVVKPGQRTRIARVEIGVTGDLARDEGDRAARLAAIKARWDLPVGQPFRQADWSTAKQRLLDAISTRDYAAATITDSEAVIDPVSAEAVLTVQVDSGPAFRFGPLEVTGLVDYDQSLIERYRPPKAGEPTARNACCFSRPRSRTPATSPRWSPTSIATAKPLARRLSACRSSRPSRGGSDLVWA